MQDSKSIHVSLIFGWIILFSSTWAQLDSSNRRQKRNIQDTDILVLRSLEEIKQQWEYFYEKQKIHNARTDQFIEDVTKELDLLKAMQKNLTNAADLEAMKSPCEDETWIPYKQDKCFKQLNSLMPLEDAINNCMIETNGLKDSLLTVQSSDEREDVYNFFFNNSLIEKGHHLLDASLGLNTTDLTQSYNPTVTVLTGQSDQQCLQMRLSEEKTPKWINVSCQEIGQFVCKKPQSLSSSVQKQLQAKLKNLDLRLAESENLIQSFESLDQNSVPVGFIYVQLPQQLAPTYLWPKLSWTDVTSTYAGKFFRAEGGNSEPFGSNQGQSAPRLNTVKYEQGEGDNRFSEIVDIPLGQSSNYLKVGTFQYNSNDYYEGVQFIIHDAEVRPDNTAVKIWMRE